MLGAFRLTSLGTAPAAASSGWIAETTVGFKPDDLIVDSSGNIYIAGRVSGADGLYLWWYSSSGIISGTKKLALNVSEATAVRLDSSNNVYVGGHYNTSGSNYRIVVAKYFTGSLSLDFQKYFDLNTSTGATGTELAYDMAIDQSNGAIYVAGTTPSFSSTTPAAFFVRMDSTATTMNWYRTFTVSNNVVGAKNIDIDSTGQVLVSGDYYATATGVQRQWIAMLSGGTTGGGTSYQRLNQNATISRTYNDQCVDSSNNVIAVGGYANSTNPNAGFIIKFTSTFTISFQVAIDHTAGQTIFDSVTTDTSGNIYVSGYLNISGSAIYIWKYNSSGTLQWIKSIAHSTRPLYNTRIFWRSSNLYIAAYNDNSQHIIVKLADTGGTDGTYGNYTISTVNSGYTTLTGTNTFNTSGMTNTSRTVVTPAALGATASTPSYTSTVTNL